MKGPCSYSYFLYLEACDKCHHWDSWYRRHKSFPSLYKVSCMYLLGHYLQQSHLLYLLSIFLLFPGKSKIGLVFIKSLCCEFRLPAEWAWFLKPVTQPAVSARTLLWRRHCSKLSTWYSPQWTRWICRTARHRTIFRSLRLPYVFRPSDCTDLWWWEGLDSGQMKMPSWTLLNFEVEEKVCWCSRNLENMKKQDSHLLNRSS